MTWKWVPVSAGILVICGGLLQLSVPLYILATLIADSLNIHFTVFSVGQLFVFYISALPLLFISIFVLWSGMCILRRKRWRLGLAGSLLAFIPVIAVSYSMVWYPPVEFIRSLGITSIPIGILAPVLVIFSKRQFERN